MNCCHCNKEINIYTDKYEMFGYDDFIHSLCRPKIEKEMSNISNMTDAQFSDWMIGGDFNESN